MTSINGSLNDVPSLKHVNNDFNDQNQSKRNYIEIDEDNNELTLLSDDDDDTNYITNDDLIEMDGEQENSLSGIGNSSTNNIANSQTSQSNNNNNNNNSTNKRRRIHKNSTYFTGSQTIQVNNDYSSNETQPLSQQQQQQLQQQQLNQRSYYNNELTDSQNSQLSVRLPFIIDYFYVVTSITGNGESIRGKCKNCAYEFSCKIRPTSNFSKVFFEFISTLS